MVKIFPKMRSESVAMAPNSGRGGVGLNCVAPPLPDPWVAVSVVGFFGECARSTKREYQLEGAAEMVALFISNVYQILKVLLGKPERTKSD